MGLCPIIQALFWCFLHGRNGWYSWLADRRKGRAECPRGRPGSAVSTSSPAAARSPATMSLWPMPSSSTRTPSGASSRSGIGGDGAIGIEAVLAAVEREPRIEVAHLRRQRGDVVGRDIGRIGDDEIEPAARAPRRSRRRRRRRARTGRGARRCCARSRSPPGCGRCRRRWRCGSSDSSASSSAPEPMPRSAMRSARERGPLRRRRRAPPRPRSRCPAAAPAPPA